MIVLVTGCRSGFGLSIAIRAAKKGHTVYAGLRDLRTKDELVRAAEGLDVRPVQLDVVDAEQREEVMRAITEAHGGVDALVNNAGVTAFGFQEQIREDELRRLFDVNVFAPFALTKLCLPSLRGRGGVVINISSMSGRNGLPGLGAYASTKFALEGMTEALRHEMRPFGVRVVLVEPGPYKTDLSDPERFAAKDTFDPRSPYAPYVKKLQALFQKMEARMGDPNEVSELVVRLLDDPSPRLRYPLGPGVSARLWIRRLFPFEASELVFKRLAGF
jgi:NAD(P)-dependent dehydrogenase (short-subunit alcohol dehydrogenase family)